MKLWRDWEKVWYTLASGDVAQYEKIKGTEEVEFYSLFDLFKENAKKWQKNT